MAARYRFGPFTFDPRDGELRKAEHTQRLQPLVAALLERFVASPGRMFAHHELMELLWPDAFVNGEALTQVLSRLRRALGETRTDAHYIETLHKRGYRFVAEVTTEEAEAPPAPVEVTAQTTLRGETTLRRFVALSIAAHAEPNRIGEVARLPLLELGEVVRVSRLEPLFVRLRADAPRPLADPYLSREPIMLRREGDVLVVASSQPDVRVDGALVRVEARVNVAALAAGVTIELGDRATIVVHTCAEPKPPKSELGLVGASAATEALRSELVLAVASGLPLLIAGAGRDDEAPLLRALSASFEGPIVPDAEALSAAELATAIARGRVVLTTTLSASAVAAHPILRGVAAYGLGLTPLGERRADVAPLLVAELEGLVLAAPVIARLVRHDWPGGLAELRAVARQLAVVARDGPVHELPRYLDARFPRRA